MSEYRRQWQLIAARIDGLVAAGQPFLAARRVQSSDPYDISGKVFTAEAKRIVEAVKSLRNSFAGSMPASARQALDRFFATEGLASIVLADDIQDLESLKTRLPILAALGGEVTYLLNDQSAIARRLSERAFAHLQRSIVVDDQYRKKWQRAFKTDEPACERLGSLHLLQHGIYAFKADPGGARTDLILGEPIVSSSALASASEALVLTEWKRVTVPAKVAAMAEMARKQAELYKQGALAGFELRDYRYIVLVSHRQLPAIADIVVSDICYQHVNVAVAPLTPSKAAAKN